MTLTQLRYFLAIVRAGSMSGAAAQVHIAQPALSQQVRMLEQELGQVLLRRHARGVALTEAGQRFREHAIDILRRVDILHDAFVSTELVPAGTVALGLATAINTGFSVPVYVAVHERFSQVRLRLVESMSGYLVEWVQQGRLDMALVYDMDAQAHEGFANSLTSSTLGREDLFLIAPMLTGAPDDLPDAPVALQTLSKLPMILPGFPHTLRMLIDRQLAQARCGLTMHAEIDSMFTIKALVQARLGYSILSAHAVRDEISQGKLRALPIAEPGISRSVDLVTGLHRYADPAVVAVRQVVADVIRKGLAD